MSTQSTFRVADTTQYYGNIALRDLRNFQVEVEPPRPFAAGEIAGYEPSDIAEDIQDYQDAHEALGRLVSDGPSAFIREEELDW